MAAESFLSGKVTKQTLPAVPVPAGSEAPILKRLLLPNGELAQFYDSDASIRYIAMIELLDGTTRGNHYHRQKMESIYLSHGEIQLLVEDIQTKERKIIPLRAGDLVCIHPGIAHTLRVVKAGRAVEFAPARFDPADTWSYALA